MSAEILVYFPQLEHSVPFICQRVGYMSSWDSWRPANYTTAPSCRARLCQQAWFLIYIGLTACFTRPSSKQCIDTTVIFTFIIHFYITLHHHHPSSSVIFLFCMHLVSFGSKKDLPQLSHDDKSSSLNFKYKIYFAWRHGLSLINNLCELICVFLAAYTHTSFLHQTHITIHISLFACSILLFAQDSSEPLLLAVSIWCVCVCVLGRENEREKQCLSSWCYLCVCVLNSLRLSSMLHSYYRLKNRWIKKTQTICVPRWCADFLENKKKSLERQNLSCKNHQFHDFKKAEGFHSCQTQTWVFFWLKELRLKIF